MKKEDWIWMPHPGHFICSKRCFFRLCTWVGNYIVSTVGELLELPTLKITELGEVGPDRKYETLVFKAIKTYSPNEGCCPYTPEPTSEEMELKGYNDAKSAMEGHMKLCEKWAKKKAKA